MYRHIIEKHSKNETLEKKLDRLDEYFYDILGLIPAREMLFNATAEELVEMNKYSKKTKELTNDFIDIIIEEDEKLNMIDTKLDGLESMLKDIQKSLDNKTMTKAELAEALNMPESTVRERLK